MLKTNHALAFVVIGAASVTMCAAPVGLQSEPLANPLGIDADKPSLSWQSDSTERGWRETAFQILVASRVELLSAGIAEGWDMGTARGETWRVGRPTRDLQAWAGAIA